MQRERENTKFIGLYALECNNHNFKLNPSLFLLILSSNSTVKKKKVHEWKVLLQRFTLCTKLHGESLRSYAPIISEAQLTYHKRALFFFVCALTTTFQN